MSLYLSHLRLLALLLCSLSASALDKYEDALRQNKIQVYSLTNETKEAIVQTEKLPESPVLDIYCYEAGRLPCLETLWTSVCYQLFRKGGEERWDTLFELYIGANESSVYRSFEESEYNWKTISLSLDPTVCCSPFERCCIGIRMPKRYGIQLAVQAIDPWLIGMTWFGILLFIFAGELSRNYLFHYASGVSVGVLASIILIFIILSRLCSKKVTIAAVSVAAGGSLTLWFVRWLWNNIQVALGAHMQYLFGYLVASSVLSFSVCYYLGPITNERLMNLIKWFLQGVSFLFIYNGMQITEYAVVLMCMLVGCQVLFSFRAS